MNVVVSRQQPSLPAWVLMGAVLVLLFVFGSAWWVARAPVRLDLAPSRPSVEDSTPPQADVTEQPAPSAPVLQPRRIVDWSKPAPKDGLLPPEQQTEDQASPDQTAAQDTPATPDAGAAEKAAAAEASKAQAEARRQAKADAQSQAQTQAQDEQVVPPPVRIHPEAAAPRTMSFGGGTWRLSSSSTVGSEEADLAAVGEDDAGHTVFALSNDMDNPSVLFVEVSPGSGRYYIYRPEQ